MSESDYAEWAASQWAELVPDIQPGASRLAVALQRTARLLGAAQTRRLRSFAGQGITGLEDFRTIALLRRAKPPGLQVSDVATLLGITRGATSNRMERFVNEELAARTDNPSDRRSHYINLTAKGVELADEMYRSVSETHNDFFEALSAEESSFLARALHQLLLAHEAPAPKTSAATLL